MGARSQDQVGGAGLVTAARSLSPSFVAYAVGPVAFVLLVVCQRLSLVADAPAWAYGAAIAFAQVSGRLVERWPDAPRGTARLHARVAIHVTAVTLVIYMSGWGPALGMAYAFSALVDLQRSGAGAWRAALGWSWAACAAGQLLVLHGWAPTFLTSTQSQTIGFLGAFVFGIAIRMAGAVAEHQERADALLADQMLRASLARDDAQRSRDEARRREAHHRAVVENAAEGILTFGLDGTVASFNAAAERMFGWPAGEIVGQSLTRIVPAELHEPLVEFLRSYERGGQEALQRSEVEIAGVRRDGSHFPMVVSTTVVALDGAAPFISGIIRDLSEQKQFEAQLAHQALHDSLTGLANRVRLTDRLEQALARARRHDLTFGVLYVDLDRFKPVNDTMGHAVGDQLLVEAARRIEAVVRETDTVARLGGDEFVVLCDDVDDVHDLMALAQRIITTIAVPFHIGDDEARVTASVGIAVTIGGSETAEALLANADAALYRAKGNGRSRFELFDEAMQEWITSQLALETELRGAVPRGELRLFCQPIVDVGTERVEGFEALVRWDRPGQGLVPPAEFIPVAEETGVIAEIGSWVLGEACQQAAAWARRWPARRVGISVNLSSRQLLAGDFVDVVRGALRTSGLDPTLLTLELTESTLVDDAVTVQPRLCELRGLGVNLALDDFGTGYSSLTYLRMFPINIVKIDKTFVLALGTAPEDTAIVAGVIALARDLGIHVIAEGVEDDRHLAVLRDLACPQAQGYLFAHPRPIEDAPSMLEPARPRLTIVSA